MPRTITKTYQLFTFDELDDNAKDKARDWFREASSGDEWWECIYEDAKTIGLRITAFDIDRGSFVKGDFMQSAERTAKAILANHVTECETFKTAAEFLTELEKLEKLEGQFVDDDYKNDAREELEDEFMKALREDYRIMLSKEYEFQQSNETVDENIRANEYTFDETGKRCD